MAVVSTNGPVTVYGRWKDGVLIQYAISKTRNRFGWLLADDLPESALAALDTLPFNAYALDTTTGLPYEYGVLIQAVTPTDDPAGACAPQRFSFPVGTSVHCLAAYQDFIYVEGYVDGVLRMGFVPAGTVDRQHGYVEDYRSVMDHAGVYSEADIQSAMDAAAAFLHENWAGMRLLEPQYRDEVNADPDAWWRTEGERLSLLRRSHTSVDTCGTRCATNREFSKESARLPARPERKTGAAYPVKRLEKSSSCAILDGESTAKLFRRKIMKTMLLHGLGQTSSSWKDTVNSMGRNTDILCPNLFDWLEDKEVCYQTLYVAFSDYCQQFSDPLNICGLSLGGILALQYAIEHPDSINALALAAVQYRMPKKLLQFQNMLFHFMPERAFQSMGLGKTAWIRLSKSMMALDFQKDLKRINCPVMVLCGEKDTANKQASFQLQSQLPHAELRMMKNCGHEINMDDPEDLGQILYAFFNQ